MGVTFALYVLDLVGCFSGFSLGFLGCDINWEFLVDLCFVSLDLCMV